MFLEQWVQWLTNSVGAVVLALAAISIVLVATSIALLAMAISLRRRLSRLMLGSDGMNFEEMLNRYGTAIDQTIKKQEEDALRLQNVEKGLQRSLAGVGLVRFNAFQETGSDLSFSLALVDRERNGVVITSIYGREETRCYGKPVKKGKSSHLLSEEEKKALEEATKKVTRSRKRV